MVAPAPGGNNPSTSFGFGAYSPMVNLPGSASIGQAEGNYAGLDRDQLNALIQFRQQQLAAQQRQADAQNALAGRQMDQQGGQFGQQLSFNEMVQRAQEAATEKQRVTSEMIARGGLQNTQIGLQQQEQQARQAQAQQSFGAYDRSEIDRRAQEINQTQFGATNELARRNQLANEAMGKANLSASLRGSSNAFKQLEVNGLMNASGLGSLSSILSGNERAPQFQAPGGTPEAATLGTLSRDMGENQSPGDWQQGVFRAPTSLALDPNGGAGMRGMLGVGQQNQSQIPDYDPNSPYWMARREAIQNGQVMQRLGAQPGVGPGQSMGAELVQGLPKLIAARGGRVPSWDDPELQQLYMTAAERAGSPISQAQAAIATRFASDYYQSYGVALNEGQLNDMVGGQIARGAPPDPAGWRPAPGGMPPLLPGQRPPVAQGAQGPGSATGGAQYPSPGGMQGPTLGPDGQQQSMMAGEQSGGMRMGQPMQYEGPGATWQTQAAGGPEMMAGQMSTQMRSPMVAPGTQLGQQRYRPTPGTGELVPQQQQAVGVNPISDAAASGGQIPNQTAASAFQDYLRKTKPIGVNAYAFNKLKKSAQDFTIAGFESLGYDADDTREDIQRLLPKATGPQRGYVAPAGRR